MYIITFFKFESHIFTQDYPSIGQIIQKAKENNINIIFVIGGNSSLTVRNLYYDTLATLMPGHTLQASALSVDARNILDIVSDNYKVYINKCNILVYRINYIKK